MGMTPACTPTWVFHGFFGKPGHAKARFRVGLKTSSVNRGRILKELGKLSLKELQNRQKAALIHYKELEAYMVLLDQAIEKS